MNRIAHTALVAFAASMFTLFAVYTLAPEAEPEPLSDAAVTDELPEITMEELARHDHEDSCWKAIHGKVYDVTHYIPRHPTPPSVMLRWCGRESSEGWDDKGTGRPHSSRAEVMLQDYLVGRLRAE